MNIDCLIPARKGSKGIFKKNIIPLKNIPLIAYSIFVAKQSQFIRNVYVSTDSEEIADLSEIRSSNTFIRPDNLSTDKSGDKGFHSLHGSFKKIRFRKIRLFSSSKTHISGRNVEIVDRAINDFLKDKECTSLRSAHKTKNCPFKWFKIKDNYFYPIFDEDHNLEIHNMPRQVFPEVYIPNGYVTYLNQVFLLKMSIPWK